MGKLNLRDATPDQALDRLKELRQEFVDMSEGRRTGDADHDAAFRSMLDEVNELDNFVTVCGAVKNAERQRLASTYSLGAGGVRGIADKLVTDDLIREMRRSGSVGGRTEVLEHAGHSFDVTRVGDITFENNDADPKIGSQITSWMRAASLGEGESGFRAPVAEFGSSGPATTFGDSAFDSTDAGALAPRLGQPVPPVPRQARLWLRDLLPTMKTTLNQVAYVRELNPATYEAAVSGGAVPVAEGGTKPTATLSFVPENAGITTVATTLVLSKQMFDDAQAVVQYINQRLPYLVRFAEDNQILNGSGTWPAIEGINNTSGLQSISAVSGQKAQTIGNGIAAIENSDGVATAVVMNPTDAWGMFTNRASTSGVFDAGTPFSALPLTVWGVPSYRSRVYTSGTALVADFTRGGMLADRESVSLQIYRERYAEQNLVLLVCEERLGLMNFRPDLFAKCTLS